MCAQLKVKNIWFLPKPVNSSSLSIFPTVCPAILLSFYPFMRSLHTDSWIYYTSSRRCGQYQHPRRRNLCRDHQPRGSQRLRVRHQRALSSLSAVHDGKCARGAIPVGEPQLPGSGHAESTHLLVRQGDTGWRLQQQAFLRTLLGRRRHHRQKCEWSRVITRTRCGRRRILNL